MGTDHEPEAAPDAFISHSSRDKATFVRPLVECLTEQGAHVWYDEYSMSVGDSLSASIDQGLSTSGCGVVVVSPSFIETALRSGWTSYEFRGIVSNSIGRGARRILPVWLDVSYEDVRAWSPSLSDLLAIDARGLALEEIALKLLRVIAPDRAGGLSRYRALQAVRDEGTPNTNADLSTLEPSPAVDRRVPGHVPLRAWLVTQALAETGDAHASGFDGFVEDLSRDLHHEGELRLWEAIAATFTTIRQTNSLEQPKLAALYHFILMASMGKADRDAIELLGAQVAGDAWDHLQSLLPLVRNDAVIGEGGLRGVILPTATDSDPSPGQQ